jgi:hypothetical protein
MNVKLKHALSNKWKFRELKLEEIEYLITFYNHSLQKI